MNPKRVRTILEKIDLRVAKEQDKTDDMSIGYTLAMRHCRGMIEEEFFDELEEKYMVREVERE